MKCCVRLIINISTKFMWNIVYKSTFIHSEGVNFEVCAVSLTFNLYGTWVMSPQRKYYYYYYYYYWQYALFGNKILLTRYLLSTYKNLNWKMGLAMWNVSLRHSTIHVSKNCNLLFLPPPFTSLSLLLPQLSVH